MEQKSAVSGLVLPCLFLLFVLKILLIFREGEGRGERGQVKHQCVVASCAPSTEDLACNPGMCPDWESNQWHWFTGPHSIHWATPARACPALIKLFLISETQFSPPNPFHLQKSMWSLMLKGKLFFKFQTSRIPLVLNIYVNNFCKNQTGMILKC